MDDLLHRLNRTQHIAYMRYANQFRFVIQQPLERLYIER